ncbi:MAG: dihydrofolate reductase [Planctomycetota bacterium]|jgi:dihydrofolate reductase
MIKSIIVAVSTNGAIGRDNDIPWHYPADMKHFRDTTRGYPIIAGRKTYESFQVRPLPKRLNIVLSRDANYQAEGGAHVCTCLQAAFTRAEIEDKGKVFILGGAEIYRQALPLTDEMVITFVPEEIEGDAFFPPWDRGEWNEIERRQEENLVFATYRRR